MSTNTDYGVKGRALFLSALMILSVVAASVAFATPAAAAVSADDQDVAADGSTIEITIDGASGGIDPIPEGWTAESPSDGGNVFATGGINWGFDSVDSRTVSVTLTPPNDASPGDSVTLTAYDGSGNEENFDVSVIESQNIQTNDIFLTNSETPGNPARANFDIVNNGQNSVEVSSQLILENTDTSETVDDTNTTTVDSGETFRERLSVDTTGLSPDNEYELRLLVNGEVVEVNSDFFLQEEDETGALTGTVSVTGGGALPDEDLEVEIYQGSLDDAPPRSPFDEVEVDNLGRFTSNELPAATGGTNYSVFLETDRFEEFSETKTINPGDGKSISIILSEETDAAKVGVALWDAENERAISPNAALLADGEFDGPVTLAVYAQSSDRDDIPAPAVGDDITADVTVSGLDDQNELFDTTNDEGPFLDNDPAVEEESEPSLRVGLDSDPIDADNVITDVDDAATLGDADLNQPNSEFNTSGSVRYGTFNVTAGDVDEQDVREFYDAVAQGEIEASIAATDTTGSQEISDTADLTYFVEGDVATQHTVLDVRDSSPVPQSADPTVWAAYQGAPQNYDTVRNFTNDDGESFLTGSVNEDGKAVIPGLVSDVPYNVYVTAEGYNGFNSTDVRADTSNGFLNGTGLGSPDGSGALVADFTLNETIQDSNDGSGDARVYSHVLRPTALDIALDVTALDQTSEEFVKRADVEADTETQILIEAEGADEGSPRDEYQPLPDQRITAELVRDTSAGSLDATDDNDVVEEIDANEVIVETDEDGQAIARFTAQEQVDTIANVSASATNTNDDLYITNSSRFVGQGINTFSDQAELDVSTRGSLTGDTVDETREPVENVEVVLEKENRAGNFEFVTSTNSGEAATYAFFDLETGADYRVEGTVRTADDENITGFATRDNLQPGTNTKDITLEIGSNTTVDPGGPDGGDGSEPGLSRFDQDDSGEIEFQEVLAAITAENEDTQIGGEPVRFQDVLSVITAEQNDTPV